MAYSEVKPQADFDFIRDPIPVYFEYTQEAMREAQP
jgi:hypothetical protein